MAFEKETVYRAVCCGPSDLGDGCPDGAVYENVFGDEQFSDQLELADQARGDGWFVEVKPSGYPHLYGEVMCPTCKEAAGE